MSFPRGGARIFDLCAYIEQRRTATADTPPPMSPKEKILALLDSVYDVGIHKKKRGG